MPYPNPTILGWSEMQPFHAVQIGPAPRSHTDILAFADHGFENGPASDNSPVLSAQSALLALYEWRENWLGFVFEFAHPAIVAGLTDTFDLPVMDVAAPLPGFFDGACDVGNGS